jgi:serine/threonine protein kinase
VRKKRSEPKLQPKNIGQWKIDRYLDSGGNGHVWIVTTSDGRRAALKVLRTKYQRADSKRYRRFKDEVGIQTSLSADPGVLPVVEFHLPDEPSPEDPGWLATEIAKPIKRGLGRNASISSIVEAVASVAEVLARLHAKDTSHRDIKPGNLFLYEGRWVVGDFGLASFLGKAGVTTTGESVGPYLYMAPEMISRAKGADPMKADVYSLAKTLWVLATGQNYPLPGEHPLEGTQRIAAIIDCFKADQLDRLITRATKTDPAERLEMAGIACELRAWLAPPVSLASPGDMSILSARIARASAAVIDAGRVRMQRIHEATISWQRVIDRLEQLREEISHATGSGNTTFERPGGSVGVLNEVISRGNIPPMERVDWAGTCKIFDAGPGRDPPMLLVEAEGLLSPKGDFLVGAHIRFRAIQCYEFKTLWCGHIFETIGSAKQERAVEELFNQLAEQILPALEEYASALEANISRNT